MYNATPPRPLLYTHPFIAGRSHVCSYIGTVPVDSSTGKVMCTQAVERMTSLKVSTQAVKLRVTTRRIRLTEKKTGDMIKDIPLRNISYLCNTGGKGGTFCLVQQDKTGLLSLCHAFKVGKGVSEKIASAVAMGSKLRQGKLSLGQLNTVMKEAPCSAAAVSKVEAAWALRATEVDRGAKLAEFPGCCYFGS